MEISILMPCYNESKHIIQALESVEAQTFESWELIIVDDGSTDETYHIVKEHISNSPHKDKFQLIQQPNSDQLIALQNALHHASGAFVYVLHGDDFLLTNKSLETLMDAVKAFPHYDAYMAPYTQVDAQGAFIKNLPLRPYLPPQHSLALMQLWMGRNLYNDFGLIKKSAALKSVLPNYLIWNMPFWANLLDDTTVATLNCYNLSESVYGYRFHEGNYLHSSLGAANVFSGEMRTFLNLAKNQNIPLFKLQYFVFRALNKLVPKYDYKPLVRTGTQTNLSSILKFMMEKYKQADLISTEPFCTVYQYFVAREKSSVHDKDAYVSEIPKLPADFFAPTGAQMLLYNKRVRDNALTEEETHFLAEIKKGPTRITCDPEDKDAILRYLTYLGLQKYIAL